MPRTDASARRPANRPRRLALPLPPRSAGIIYLVLKAAAYLLNLLLAIPAVTALLASLRDSVGL